MAKSLGERVSILIAEGKLKHIDFGPANPDYKSSGKFVVDSRALKNYLDEETRLENECDKNNHIRFGYAYARA